MRFVSDNPYRLIGVLPTVSSKDLYKQKIKIERFLSVNQSVDNPYNFSIFPSIEMNQALLTESFSKLEKADDKVLYALFWLGSGGVLDDAVIAHLVEGNFKQGFDECLKLVTHERLTSKNFFSFCNISTLYLCSLNTQSIQKGIRSKFALVQSDYFLEFVKKITHSDTAQSKDYYIKLLINYIFKELAPKGIFTSTSSLPISEFFDLFLGLDKEDISYIFHKSTDRLIYSIEQEIENLKKNIDIKSTYQQVQKFLKNVYRDMTLLREIVNHPLFLKVFFVEYQTRSDHIAELLFLSVNNYLGSDSIKSSQSDKTVAVRILKIARRFAISPSMVKDIEESTNILVFLSIYEEFSAITEQLSKEKPENILRIKTNRNYLDKLAFLAYELTKFENKLPQFREGSRRIVNDMAILLCNKTAELLKESIYKLDIGIFLLNKAKFFARDVELKGEIAQRLKDLRGISQYKKSQLLQPTPPVTRMSPPNELSPPKNIREIDRHQPFNEEQPKSFTVLRRLLIYSGVYFLSMIIIFLMFFLISLF